MYAAYEALSDRMKQYLAGLTAIHDGEGYRGQYANYGVKDKPSYPRAEHPVVRTHPVTGKKPPPPQKTQTCSRITLRSRPSSDPLSSSLDGRLMPTGSRAVPDDVVAACAPEDDVKTRELTRGSSLKWAGVAVEAPCQAGHRRLLFVLDPHKVNSAIPLPTPTSETAHAALRRAMRRASRYRAAVTVRTAGAASI